MVVLVRNAAAGRGFIYPCFLFRPVGFCCSKILRLCHLGVTKSACPTAAKKRLLPHSAAPQSMPPPLFRVSRKQRYNTLDFASKIVCQQGCCAPLLETQRQRDVPFAIPHFPRRCIYKLQNAACNACSENAKGSLRRCVAQTSFWAEMQKKGTAISSAFPQPTRRGRGTTNGENLNIAKHGMVLSENPPVLLYYCLSLGCICIYPAKIYADNLDTRLFFCI